MIAGGVLGAFVSGIYVDRSKKFAEVIKVSYTFAVFAGLAFTQVSLETCAVALNYYKYFLQ